MYLEMLYDHFNKTADNSPMTKSAVANKAFRRLAKKFIRPKDIFSYETVPNGVRYNDLNMPLKERLDYKYSYKEPVALSLEEPYKNYLARVWHKDPRIARYTDISKKLDRAKDMQLHLDARSIGSGAQQLENDVRRNGFASYLAAAQSREVPRITVYKAKTPYATTHHLANGPASLAANKAAQNAAPGELLVKNPNPDAGWRNYRNTHFRVNTPGAPWSPEELELMRTSSNLSNTNLYETVFSRIDRNFPAPIATYVPDTPAIRQTLALKPNVKGVPIDELQSKVQGLLYKGQNVDDLYPIKVNKFYRNAVQHYVPNRFKKKIGTILEPDTSIELPNKPERWFAPSSRTSMGYAGANDAQKFIRLDSDALRKLREVHTASYNNIPELEAYTEAAWANMFRTKHQQRRMHNIIERLTKARNNTMPEDLYWLARQFSRRQV